VVWVSWHGLWYLRKAGDGSRISQVKQNLADAVAKVKCVVETERVGTLQPPVDLMPGVCSPCRVGSAYGLFTLQERKVILLVRRCHRWR
jgi:hypothetical protein